MKKHTLFIVFIISIALIIGIWRESHEDALVPGKKQFSQQSFQQSAQPPLSSGVLFPTAKKLPVFRFEDMNTQVFNNSAFEKHWSFVFFGYTACPEICPTTLSNLQAVAQRLRAGPLVQYVFISIDPEHDTASELKTYFSQARFKDTPFIGVTGNKENILSFAESLGIHAASQRETGAEHLAHGGSLLVINPDGEFCALFTSSEKASLIAHDFKEIMHQYAKATRLNS